MRQLPTMYLGIIHLYSTSISDPIYFPILTELHLLRRTVQQFRSCPLTGSALSKRFLVMHWLCHRSCPTRPLMCEPWNRRCRYSCATSPENLEDVLLCEIYRTATKCSSSRKGTTTYPQMFQKDAAKRLPHPPLSYRVDCIPELRTEGKIHKRRTET